MSNRIATATLQPREDRRLLRGHCWAFRNEFKQLPEIEDGALIDVFSAERRFVGRGFYQSRGGIAIRLLTRRQEDIDTEFFTRRLDEARALRARLFPGENVYRWIFGESDGLPGLVVDRYGETVIAETTCAYYLQQETALLGALRAQPGVESVRLLAPDGAHDHGTIPDPCTITFEGFDIVVPLDRPQKTGLFLDQRLNRRCVEPFAPGSRVLDAHCHAGLWSLHAARAGAEHVHGVDTSAPALDTARENARRNGVETRCTFECAEAEQILARGERYDVIVLDPPAFAKGRDHAKQALGRYQTLNRSAMRALPPGGVLITSSCSHFVDAPAFIEILKRAAASAQRHATLLDFRGAAPDHPVLLAMPDTAYLKCAVLRIE